MEKSKSYPVRKMFMNQVNTQSLRRTLTSMPTKSRLADKHVAFNGFNMLFQPDRTEKYWSHADGVVCQAGAPSSSPRDFTFNSFLVWPTTDTPNKQVVRSLRRGYGSDICFICFILYFFLLFRRPCVCAQCVHFNYKSKINYVAFGQLVSV